jgi:hypothetical protein
LRNHPKSIPVRSDLIVIKLDPREASFMRYTIALMMALLAFIAVPAPSTAQDYWEYAPWEGEWEHHYPTQGVEVEHENDDYYEDGEVNYDREQYEWEPGEGYHEQEWYDPSDWFSFGSDTDYESDNWFSGGYLDDGYYDDDWYYDYYY